MQIHQKVSGTCEQCKKEVSNIFNLVVLPEDFDDLKHLNENLEVYAISKIKVCKECRRKIMSDDSEASNNLDRLQPLVDKREIFKLRKNSQA